MAVAGIRLAVKGGLQVRDVGNAVRVGACRFAAEGGGDSLFGRNHGVESGRGCTNARDGGNLLGNLHHRGTGPAVNLAVREVDVNLARLRRGSGRSPCVRGSRRIDFEVAGRIVEVHVSDGAGGRRGSGDGEQVDDVINVARKVGAVEFAVGIEDGNADADGTADSIHEVVNGSTGIKSIAASRFQKDFLVCHKWFLL